MAKFLFSGEVDQVDAPGVDGDFGVLEGQAFCMVGAIEEPVTKAEHRARDA